MIYVKTYQQIEYQKKGKEINDNCKAYQKLTPEVHPLVKQAKKVADLVSDVSYFELTEVENTPEII